MPDLIECCISNKHGDLPNELAGSTAIVREDGCLQRCGVCYDGPFAIVNGKLVEADTPTELQAQVGEEIQE